MATILLAGLAYDLEASIRRGLTGQGHTALVAFDAAQLFQIVEQVQPSLAILDPHLLVGGHGVQVCCDLRARPAGQNLFMIVISNRDAVGDKLDAFAAGADDYLALPFHIPELLLRVEALLRRQARLTRKQAPTHPLRRHGDIALDIHTGDVWRGERRIVVTPVEARLLNYLMTCAGRAVSAEELLQQVWTQAPGCGDPALVRVHIRHLRDKLAGIFDNTAEVLKTIPRFGYCMAPAGAT
jgi:DNA-binding response OmpR family regulator